MTIYFEKKYNLYTKYAQHEIIIWEKNRVNDNMVGSFTLET